MAARSVVDPRSRLGALVSVRPASQRVNRRAENQSSSASAGLRGAETLESGKRRISQAIISTPGSAAPVVATKNQNQSSSSESQPPAEDSVVRPTVASEDNRAYCVA